MRRAFPACHLVICHSFCLALLVLWCKPVPVSAHGHRGPEGKWESLCTADGLSIALQSSSMEDSSTAKATEARVVLSLQAGKRTIWDLRDDRDLWLGELIDQHHGESTNRATNHHQAFNLEFPIAPCSQNDTRWSQVRMLSNKQRPMHILACTATDKTGNGSQRVLVMLRKLKHSNKTAAQYNHMGDYRCLTSSNLLISLAENDTLRSVLLFHSKGAFDPVLFHPSNKCSWSNHTVISGQRYNESSAQLTLQEYGSSARLSFDEKRATQMLVLSLSLPPSFSQRTFRDRIKGVLDKMSVKYACNQGTTKEFVAKNMGNSPLQVHSSMIEVSSGRTHGFEIGPLHKFYLAPGQSAKLFISYQPDFKTEVSEGKLQIVTSAGMVSIAVSVSADILEFRQITALIGRAKSFTLQVSLMALFLVLLVFGKMLKQERENASCGSGSRRAHDKDSKRSSFHVSINLSCTHEENKHSSNSWSLGFIYAVMSCITGCKMSWNSQRSMVQDPASSSVKKGQAENYPTNLTSSSIGKKKTPTRPRACNQSSAVANLTHRSSPLRSAAYLYTRDKAIPRLKIPRPSSGSVELESPNTALSNKEREKAKQKKKKGNMLQVPAMETGSNTGCSSPLSMPSSPVTRGTSVSPVTCKTRTSLQDHDKTQSSNVSRGHSSSNSRLQCSDGNFAEPNKLRKPANSRNPEKSNDTKGIKSSEEKRKNVVTRTKCATLKVSHTFPAAGQRFSEDAFQSSEEDGQKWSLFASSSSSDLVSTSSMASHARAPGSPLSATSQSFPNSPLSNSSSPVTGSPLSSSSSSFPRSSFSTSPAFSGSPVVHNVIPSLDSPLSSSSPSLNNPAHDHCQSLWASTTSPFFGSNNSGSRRCRREPCQPRQWNDWNGSTSNTSNPTSRYDMNGAQRKVNERRHGLQGVVLYDMWENHFTELSQRWRSSWVKNDTPSRRTMPPSSLPPLLKTPSFSIFSSNDPFYV